MKSGEDVFEWARKRFNGICIIHRVRMVEQAWKVTTAGQKDTGGSYEQTVRLLVCPRCRPGFPAEPIALAPGDKTDPERF
jgi:hypothetical protein